MSAKRKYKPVWDDASFIMRTDPEREKKPRPEPTKLPRFKRRPFDFEACRQAWAAIGVIANEKEIVGHIAALEDWLGRKL